MKFDPQLEVLIANLRGKVEARLSEVVCSLELSPALHAAATYVLVESGKRLRPLIALLIERDRGQGTDSTLSAAVALEMLHSASLVHDDLPGMDDDDFRRGKPSCHKKFDVPTALLIGDLLPAAAFELVANVDKNNLNQILTRAYRELCVGQQLDMENPTTVEELLRTHRFKTGALFGAAFVIGVESGTASRETLSLAWRAGQEFGLLFQSVDDYIDRFGDATLRGRPVSSDARNEKRTIFTLLGEADGKAFVKERYDAFVADLLALERGLGCALTSIHSLSGTIFGQIPEGVFGVK